MVCEVCSLLKHLSVLPALFSWFKFEENSSARGARLRGCVQGTYPLLHASPDVGRFDVISSKDTIMNGPANLFRISQLCLVPSRPRYPTPRCSAAPPPNPNDSGLGYLHLQHHTSTLPHHNPASNRTADDPSP